VFAIGPQSVSQQPFAEKDAAETFDFLQHECFGAAARRFRHSQTPPNACPAIASMNNNADRRFSIR
jgi:hypothetical protein